MELKQTKNVNRLIGELIKSPIESIRMPIKRIRICIVSHKEPSKSILGQNAGPFIAQLVALETARCKASALDNWLSMSENMNLTFPTNVRVYTLHITKPKRSVK